MGETMCSAICFSPPSTVRIKTKSKHDADFTDLRARITRIMRKFACSSRSRTDLLPIALPDSCDRYPRVNRVILLQCTGLLLTKYSNGNKKIQMMSTKCQYSPKFSTIV